MKLDVVFRELNSIADLSPRLRGWLNSKNKDGSYVGIKWASLMMDLDPEHFANVCYEFARAERRLPESAEELMQTIIYDSRDRKAEDVRKLKQYEDVHSRRRMVWREESRIPAAVAIQWIMRRGPVTAEQLDELVAWDRGGNKPEWVGTT